MLTGRQTHHTAHHTHDVSIESNSPMRMVRAPSIAAFKVTHVVLPLVSIVPTPLQRDADWSLLVAAMSNKSCDRWIIREI